MKVQVLISTMHQTDHSLLDKMNIQSDAIVVNQCNRNGIEEFEYKGHQILWMSLKERGVGLSRNTALMRATADIILFADDDVVYDDGYEKTIVDCFEKYATTDMLIFRVESTNKDRPTKKESRDHKLTWFNSMKYGAFRIAIRTAAIRKANVFYSLLFGGGAKYQAGEDTLFIQQCLKNKIKAVSVQKRIGIVEQNQSTWFAGSNEKYFYDKGVLVRRCFGLWAKPLLLLLLVKNRHETDELGLQKAIKYAFDGADSRG